LICLPYKRRRDHSPKKGDWLRISAPAILLNQDIPRGGNLLPVPFFWCSLAILAGGIAHAQAFDSKWRLIGPFRGGRVTSVAGVAGQPNVYYFGTPGGGVWKTTDAGHVWKPVFDGQPVSAIGAIAVAPSEPKTIYVGTGEGTAGKGLYKSTDAGQTWTRAGLEATRYIQAIVVDPRNPNIAVVGANSLGHAILWRPIPQTAFTIDRGIYKTVDGGKTWKKVLIKDDTIGVVDMCSDPSDPRTLYATLFRPASGFGDNEIKATSDVFKSIDGGSTWRPLVQKGLPEKGRGRVGIAVAAGTQGRRLYAILDQGFYRSDDGGGSWQQSTKDPRVAGSVYFSRIFADPLNPDVIYAAQTSLYRSIDGGHTFEPYVGAPSGDDFHVLWIDPRDSKRMLLGVDQGAIVTVDGGQSWSSWYNQPTGEFYHVSTDTAFPYRVYGAQQDSGTAAVASRSDYGQIGDRDWMSVGGFEYCFIAPDPLNTDLVYSGGWYGTVVRFDKTTGQLAMIFERGEKYRTSNMAPLAFSPRDPRVLYLGTQFLLQTGDAGATWQEISPDLTGYQEKDPDAARDPDQPPAPAITALAPSPLQTGLIWAGTSNRLVSLLREGSSHDVTPPGLTGPTRILALEASHSDPAGAYAVVGANRGSTAPYIARTRDYGKTWQVIVQGLPGGEMARVVREDPLRKGLLYAGTDRGVFFSFDDGDHWQTLQMNLPVVTVTDLEVHGNDLVASTFGRALWILDDVTPIREMSEKVTGANAYLIPPASALRVRWDNYQDTPYPPETPAGQNPPDGAIFDYYLKSSPSGEVILTIYDEQGKPVRAFSSDAKAPDLPLPNVPSYWFGVVEKLSKSAGLHRFVWDLRYAPPKPLPYSFGGNLLEYTEYTLADHAIPGNTPREQPQGALAVPGNYTVVLSVGGQVLRQNLTIELDPRIHVPTADLQAQLDLEQQIARGMAASYLAFEQVGALRKTLSERKKELPDAVAALEKKIDSVDKGTHTAPGLGPVNRDLTRLATSVQSADVRPAETALAAVGEKCKALDAALAKWRELNAQDVVAFNATLQGAKLPVAPADELSCAERRSLTGAVQ
jgi:photosystem II stability/assembly factor-like uncharacterized protein